MNEELQIVLGSENPIKRHATEAALATYPVADLVAEAVDSGVPAQPRGHAETRAGALRRARRAIADHDEAIGIGIEGGIGSFGGIDPEHVIMWAAVADGTRTVATSGPAVPLPASLVERVDRGTTLGAAIRERHGEDAGILGAIGVLTDGSVDREAALRVAVRAAFGRFRGG